jgi:predicted ATPase
MQDVRRNDDTRDLKTPGGIVVPWLEKTADNYLDKTTFIFGGTGSGKSTIIEEILYLCKRGSCRLRKNEISQMELQKQ